MSVERMDREFDDLLRVYLGEIGQYGLLTKDDEVALSKRIELGIQAVAELEDQSDGLSPLRRRELRRLIRDGEAAHTQFVHANLRLVVSIAKKYQAFGLPLVDLIQEGNMGLIHAVGKFDWRKGFKFSTYATWWIRQAITRGIANTGRTIRIPVHAGDILARVNRSRSKLELELGRNATVAEIAQDSGLDIDRVAECLQYAVDPLSLSEPLRDDSEALLGDMVEDRSGHSPFEDVIAGLMPYEIERLLGPLDEREREVVTLRFGLDRGDPRTLEEVGQYFHLTRERIRQIEARAIAKLRHPSTEAGGRELLLAV